MEITEYAEVMKSLESIKVLLWMIIVLCALGFVILYENGTNKNK